jgi:tripartite-type tricarboxylate transporter receptor subunit TctC
MKLPRRTFLQLAASAAALPAVSRMARAQAYPSRPVRIIVGFAAGGPADIVARLIAQWLSERLGQPFLVENRTGAATNIAAEAVVRAPADGYTLLFVTAANASFSSLVSIEAVDIHHQPWPQQGYLMVQAFFDRKTGQAPLGGHLCSNLSAP